MKLPSNKAFVTGYNWKNCTTVLAKDIPELQARYVELRHEPTGAVIIHLQNDDPENLFCLSFRTLPETSNGVAHVLEHTVLCGSEHFPVRDPFFSMTRRSLNTFMNALTGSDFTCYPAASLMAKDFYNILKVYVDSVFFPKLDLCSFLQEGHRLEFEKADDPTTPLVRKGIVYNEMKGSLSSPSSLLNEKLSSLLFKDVAYGLNSGGDPKEIPTLTLEELKKFHSTYYHPSRCLFYFYGSFSLAKHITFLEKHILNQSTQQPPLPPLPLQPRFKKPVLKDMHYPASDSPLEYVGVSWLTYPSTDIKKMIALSVLDNLLMDTDASPLKRRILSSSLAEQVYSSLQIEQRESSFSLFMTGTHKTKEEIQTTLFQFLEEIEKEGFQKKEIERALHQLELQRKEIVRESSPFGLMLFWRSGLLKQQGIDPLSGLETESYFHEIHRELQKNPRYFSELLSEALVKNPHRVLLRMTPSKTLEKKEQEEERKQLDKIQTSLTLKEKKALVKQARDLHAFQNKDGDLSSLPMIHVKDVPKKGITYSLVRESIEEQECLFSHVFTNHIVTLNIAIPLPLSLLHEPHLLKLYSLIFPQMGYGKYSWNEALERSQEYTGGIYSSISLNPSVHNPNDIQPYLHIHGNALSKNSYRLFSIMKGYLQEAHLEEPKRLEELMKKHIASLEGSLISSSLRYATLEAEKSLSVPGRLQWCLSGREYLEHIRTITSNWHSEKEPLLSQLKSIQQQVLSHAKPILIATCSHAEKEELIHFLKEEPLLHGKTESFQKVFDKQTYVEREYIALQSQSPISFSSLSLPSLSYDSNEAPYVKLLAPLLDNLILHKAIREQGGAYGGGATYNESQATFSFYTYRDPHIWKSYQAFKKSLQTVAKGLFEEKDLDEAKRECIQSLDEPLSPSSIGSILFHRMAMNKTERLRQQFRKRLLEARPIDIQQMALLLLEKSFSKSSFATMAGDTLLEEEKKHFAQKKIPLRIISI